MTAPSVIDQRLASKALQRQVAVLERSERLARSTGKAYDRLLADLLALAASEPRQADLVRLAEAEIATALRRARNTIEDGLVRLIRWAHQQAAGTLLKTIPLGWFRALEPIRLAELPEAEGPELDFDDPLGPIRRREMSREEAMDLIRSLLFEPPSAEDTERWLRQPVGDGKTWDQRLAAWDQQARDRMLPQLVESISAGESLVDLRKRLEPITGGVRYKAQRIARTEGRRVAEAAQMAADEQLGDMLAGRQWMATLDMWTRPDHAARHGKVYDRQPDGTYQARDGELLPDVPLGPNCRCITSAVLTPPEEFANNPALRARFKNASGNLIPDPAAYIRWFDQANEAQQKTAVGVRRYQAAKNRLGYEPQWQDLIDEKGNLLPIGRIQAETGAERAARRQAVDAMLLEREALYKEVSRHGFVRPSRFLPPGERPIIAGHGLPNLDTPQKLETYLRGKEHEIAGAEPGDAEWAVVFDRNGEEILRQRGETHQVEFTNEQLDKMRGQVLTHVHPPERLPSGQVLRNQPPSPDDALLLIDGGLSQVRVVTEDFHYKLETSQTGKARGMVRQWKKRCQHHRDQQARKLQEGVSQGKMTSEEVKTAMEASSAEHQHQAWMDVADRFGLRYERRRRNAKNT